MESVLSPVLFWCLTTFACMSPGGPLGLESQWQISFKPPKASAVSHTLLLITFPIIHFLYFLSHDFLFQPTLMFNEFCANPAAITSCTGTCLHPKPLALSTGSLCFWERLPCCSCQQRCSLPSCQCRISLQLEMELSFCRIAGASAWCCFVSGH